MTTTDFAIDDSLTELTQSIRLDQQMIRNYRTALVKAQQLDRVTSLREIEDKMEELITLLENTPKTH